MSPPEVRLWARLKRLRERGFHIRRQAPFRGYYLDFVCFDRRIVIEVDGGQHSEDVQADHDATRDLVLRREGFQVLRFWSSAVMHETNEVMDAIVLALEAAQPLRKKSDPSAASASARLPHPDEASPRLPLPMKGR
ncbi:MAG: endonuclease domain-containing protein, partial [Phenylobacterium sp.]|uniref:endonuclease domain-containing protein n=1 Tax=Phenylobacterium sp. TaxID=1871053 RepID=UPI003BB49C8F